MRVTMYVYVLSYCRKYILILLQQFSSIIQSRTSTCDNDLEDVNDIRNGVLLTPTLHRYLDERRFAFMKVVLFITNIAPN